MQNPTEVHIGEDRMDMEHHASRVMQQDQEHNQVGHMCEIL